jgi:hypothetical protein
MAEVGARGRLQGKVAKQRAARWHTLLIVMCIGRIAAWASSVTLGVEHKAPCNEECRGPLDTCEFCGEAY